VSLSQIKSHAASPDDVTAYYNATAELETLPITIVEAATTPAQQAGVVHRLQQSSGVDAVFVDYLGLMEPGQPTNTLHEKLTVISSNLKRMAQRFHVPVIALAQLNRACAGRENKRPYLSDLRDSGSIEQDADVVLLLHREDYYRRLQDPNSTNRDGSAEIIVAKHRNGPTGTAKMVFLDEQMRFVDYSWSTE
jgi:replicative DNA helicase